MQRILASGQSDKIRVLKSDSVLTKTSSSAVGVCLGLGVERTLFGGVVVPFVYIEVYSLKNQSPQA